MNKLIYLQKLPSKKDATDVVQELVDYPKYKSLVAMWIAGLPVPKTIIVGSINKKSEEDCLAVLNTWNTNEVSIRTDVVGGAVQAPSVQGCKIEDVWENVKIFFNHGYLPMVISTGDIFHNTFSANLLIDPTNFKELHLESVGAGFCATDINKRDIVTESGKIIINDKPQLIDYRVVDNKSYKVYVNKVKDNQISKEELRRGRSFKNKKDARLWVNEFLAQNGALLLDYPKYKPVAINYVERIFKFIPLLLKAGEIMNFSNEKYIVSFAFVLENDGDNPYFFDIHPFNGYKRNKYG